MMAEDALGRFVAAQQESYAQALAELQRGRKESHWIWFVFPQLAGLGRSPTAKHFGIRDIAEARAFLAHPLLGPRLRECTAAVLSHRDESAEAMLGPIDALKLRSSMTLFEAASEDPAPFAAALERFYGGARDPATLERLAGGGG